MSKMRAKILIIEDFEEVRKSYVDLLTHEGYDILEARQGEEALKIIKNRRPDLILLDLLLPEVDGFEVLAKLRADRQMRQIPVLVLSALNGEAHIQKILSSGAADYVVKGSHSPKELILKIRKLLKKIKPVPGG